MLNYQQQRFRMRKPSRKCVPIFSICMLVSRPSAHIRLMGRSLIAFSRPISAPSQDPILLVGRSLLMTPLLLPVRKAPFLCSASLWNEWCDFPHSRLSWEKAQAGVEDCLPSPLRAKTTNRSRERVIQIQQPNAAFLKCDNKRAGSTFNLPLRALDTIIAF